MNHKEFFNILVGKPPLEVELEIEMKCREVDKLTDSYLRAYTFALVKENRLQDMLIMAAIQRIQETEIKLMRYDMAEHHRTKNLALQKKKRVKKKTIIQKLKAIMGIIS